jgi:hypothetical protein
MPVQPPLRDLIDDGALGGAELRQAGCGSIHELTE